MTIPSASPTIEAIQITSEPNLTLILVIVLGISCGVGLFALTLFCLCIWLRRQYLKRSSNFISLAPVPPSSSHPHFPQTSTPPGATGVRQGNNSGSLTLSGNKLATTQLPKSPSFPNLLSFSPLFRIGGAVKVIPTPKRLFPTQTSTPSKLSNTSSTGLSSLPPLLILHLLPEELLNKGFLFLKPPANTLLTQSFVYDHLLTHGFQVSDQRILSGSDLMSRYNAFTAPIAHKALVLSPAELEISLDHQELFEAKYGISWREAIAQGLLHNAQSAGDFLQLTTRDLYDLWTHASRTNSVLQLAPDCWVGLLEPPLASPTAPAPSSSLIATVFCVNGFFPEIQDQYLLAANSGTGVWCCNVSWSDSLMSWRRCLTEIIGHPNPAVAQEGSLRKIFLSEWAELEQLQEPTLEENGIHFSVSAFEACAERELWMSSGASLLSSDPLGSRLSSVGLTPLIARDWLSNGGSGVIGALSLTIYEQLEGLGCLECLQKIQQLLQQSNSHSQDKDQNQPTSPLLPLSIGSSSLSSPQQRQSQQHGQGLEKGQGTPNSAFLLFSPEASALPSVLSLAAEFLTSHGCLIVSQGDLLCSPTLAQKLDSLHPETAKHALTCTPSSLHLSPRQRIQFQKLFQISWTDALHLRGGGGSLGGGEGGVMNATEAMKRWHLTAIELYQLWCVAVQKNQILCFSSDLLCALLELPSPSLSASGAVSVSSGGRRFYCINGFYPHLRGRYLQPPPLPSSSSPSSSPQPQQQQQQSHGKSKGKGARARTGTGTAARVRYMCVEWNPYHLSWSAFSHQLIGHPHASLAEPSSLRAQLLDLCLSSTPPSQSLPGGWAWDGFQSHGHGQFLCASQSAWEAMRQREVWLGISLTEDPLGQQLLSAGIPLEIISQWIAGSPTGTAGATHSNSTNGAETHSNGVGVGYAELFHEKGNQECLSVALELLSNSTEGLSSALRSQQSHSHSPSSDQSLISVRYLHSSPTPGTGTGTALGIRMGIGTEERSSNNSKSMQMFSPYRYPYPSPAAAPSSLTPLGYHPPPSSHPSPYPPTPFLSRPAGIAHAPTEMNSNSLDSIPERQRERSRDRDRDRAASSSHGRRSRASERERESRERPRGEKREVHMATQETDAAVAAARDKERDRDSERGKVRSRRGTGYPQRASQRQRERQREEQEHRGEEMEEEEEEQRQRRGERREGRQRQRQRGVSVREADERSDEEREEEREEQGEEREFMI